METVQQVPPGGWRYKVALTNTTVVGSSWDDLVSAVTNHLKHNGVALVDIEEQIRVQYRKDHPGIKF